MLKNLKISSADSRTIKTVLRTKKWKKKEAQDVLLILINKHNFTHTPHTDEWN